MSGIYIKTYRIIQYDIEEYIVALCDKELIGKKFSDGNLRLFVNPRFYKGKIISKKKAIEELRKATIANIVGKRAIDLAIKAGIIKEENVIKIKDIPHAQLVSIIE
ncbi:MAG: DUF424 domain-containing protein [Candidatus Parvarchaeota archaeon]|nr:DUF424 domain-containing protein [Candidatus Jingweiarchaeum tengchongense]MCW1300108.1 DUF424 domain-containing protein [Candidatus Jingweiarchaeum tengchongense]MCW1304462.1 DUF424 domain-containing protein [Candidatus Jingweiarchaeum tengchongense]MCW1305629.1 DUF424 domain-containing protein [Candidatus Jingweiarchaeum tengchongense]MCW1311009.1 DUF424 domain-containing protein [Candidatus Jingweiarchaeum tengchongense]